MKRFIFANLFVISCFSLPALYGQMPPSAKMESSIKPTNTIESTMTPLEKPVQGTSTTTTEKLPPPVKPPVLFHQHADYLHPGILVFLNGKWEGSDHLLNLPNNIGVFVTIVKPENENLEFSRQDLQLEVEKIFNAARIKPQTLTSFGQPPLPAFEVEIFIYPIDKGYVACCDGRLMESVTLSRFKMDSNMAFQAITWEKQSLIVSPKDQFKEQIIMNVQQIASAFVERFQAYEKMKK